MMTESSNQTRRKSKVRFRGYKNGPTGFQRFFDLVEDIRRPNALLVISTLDVQITLRRIEDNTTIPVHVIREEDVVQKRNMISEYKENSITICKARENITELLEKLSEEENEDYMRPKMIILTEAKYHDILKDVDELLKWRTSSKGNIYVEHDTVIWAELGEAMKQEVLQRKIMLQTKETTLKEFMKINDDFKEATTLLNGQLLIDLINDKCPIIFRDRIQPLNQGESYVARKISPRNQISSQIFQNLGQDLFLFTGIKKEQLISKYVTRGKTYSTGENLAVDGNLLSYTPTDIMKFQILTKRNEFEDISEKYARPVHHLHHNDGVFTWVKSKGSLSTIQDAIEMSNKYFDEDEPDFLSHFESNQITLLSGDGGSGKTKFLENVGRKLQERYPNDFVFFIPSSQLSSKMREEYGPDFSHDDLLNGITDALNLPKFETEIFKITVKKMTPKIHFLLDAFDQVEEKNVMTALKCFQKIRDRFENSIRVWVTLRPHLLRLAENSLESLNFSYELKPMSTTQQAQMLVSHWVHEDSNEQLLNFGDKCLQLVDHKGWEMLKQPKQLQLLANIFQNKSQPETLNPDSTSTVKINEIDIGCKTLADFCMIQFNNIRNKYRSLDQENCLDETDLLYQLMYEAIQHQFPGWAKPFQKLLQKQDKTTGLVNSSFVPFLLAYFIVEVILKEGTAAIGEDKHEFIFTEFLWNNLECVGLKKQIGNHMVVVYEFKYPITAHILNDMIADLSHVDKAITESLQDTVTSHRLKQLASACACSNYSNLLQWILARRPFEEHDYNVFDEALLYIAVSKSNTALLGNLIGKYMEQNAGTVVRDISLMPGVSLLQAAVTRGNLSIVEYVLGPLEFQQLVRFGDPNSKSERDSLPKSCRGLLHLIVSNTSNTPISIIEQKKEIIRKLLKINELLISEKDKQGCKPIVSPFAHVDLLIELINLGADVLAGNELGETVLHIAAGYMSPSDYNILLHAIPSSFINGLLKSRPGIKRTPLHCILQHFEPLEETLKLFMKYDGIDVNAADENGENVIDIALKQNRSPECIGRLLAHVTNKMG